jgi:anti-sigma factor RsiW
MPNIESNTITDEILGAYVDGELEAAERAELEKRLAKDAGTRRRVEEIRRITALVRNATFAPRAAPSTEAPKPTVELHVPRRARSGWFAWGLAASFVGGAVAVTLAVRLAGAPTPASHGWQQSALVFHTSYLRARADGRPELLLDVGEPDAKETASAYAPIIDYEPVLPDLSDHDYAPLGSRLVTSPDGPTVFVVYESPGQSPVGFSVTRTGAAFDAKPETLSLHDVRLVSWSNGEFAYGLSSDLPADTLSALAATAQRSLEGAALPVL